MDPVTHFEIPVDDMERAEAFYKLFNWEINKSPMPDGNSYTIARSVEVDEESYVPKKPGAINGGLIQRTEAVNAPLITITVASIDDTLEKVAQAGGSVVAEKQSIEDMGHYAYIKDSEGNLLGLWEDIKTS